MSDFKKLAASINTSAEAREIEALAAQTGNIYKSLAIIAKRSAVISQNIKQELHEKLEDFATQVENLEEVMENKEQIEISRFYERLPNPALIATYEFITNRLHYTGKEERESAGE